MINKYIHVTERFCLQIINSTEYNTTIYLIISESDQTILILPKYPMLD
jgi:hypothetical protein